MAGADRIATGGSGRSNARAIRGRGEEAYRVRTRRRADLPFDGISIGYPSGWKTRAATEPWGDKIVFDAPHTDDVIFDPGFEMTSALAVVSEPLGSTSPQDQGIDHYDHQGPSTGVCYPAGPGGSATASWETCHFWRCYAPRNEDRQDGHIAIFATPTRGFVIYVHIARKRKKGTWADVIPSCPTTGPGSSARLIDFVRTAYCLIKGVIGVHR